MDYAVQDIKVSENLVLAKQTRELQKLYFTPKPNTTSLRDYQLILCMFAFLN